MHMSEMDAFELLSLLGAKYPQTRVIVMTNNASSMFRAKIRQMPSVIHFDQALDVSMLTKRIFTELQIDYGGQVRGITLSSFLQMLELEDAPGLRVSAKGKVGDDLYSPRQACSGQDGAAGGKGRRRTHPHLGKRDDRYRLCPGEITREIDTPLMNLLLESGRIVDEKQSQRPDFRNTAGMTAWWVWIMTSVTDLPVLHARHQRGGAYIETEQPVKWASASPCRFRLPCWSGPAISTGRWSAGIPMGLVFVSRS
jgi:CheY-like chemotaxis protein